MTSKVHVSRKASKELEARIREMYVSGSMSYSELSKQSAQLFGQHVPAQSLRNWSFKTSPSWEVQRNNFQSSLGGESDGLSIQDEVENVRRFLYWNIEASATNGLYITFDPSEIDPKEVRAAIAEVTKDLPGVRIKSGGQLEAPIVNAYVGLLAKTGADLSPTGSAATDLETVQREAVDAANALQKNGKT